MSSAATMSQKVNSKNLSYNSSLPPFLAALQAQAKGSSGPDPLISAQRRPGKKRSGSEEAEDAPLVVDVCGNTVSVTVDKDGVVKGHLDGEDEQESTPKEDAEKLEKSTAQATTQIGGRKRKVGKVIGEDAPGQTLAEDKTDKDRTDSRASTQKENTQGDKKLKKKAKKIKLSFDED